jgi:penicillin-binding protein 1C
MALLSRRVYLQWLALLAKYPVLRRFATMVDSTQSQVMKSLMKYVSLLFAPVIWAWSALLRAFGIKARSRRGRMSESEKHLRRIKLIRLGALLFLVAVVVGVTGFFALFAWFSRDLPQPGQVVRRDGFSTQFYDRDGDVLYDFYSEERRDPVSIDAIPESLKQATIAVEDKDFYRHRGFDMLTIVRIPYNYVFRQRVVGGSTLTQQLVKNVLLTNERTVTRKFKEFVLALQIERTFTKDQILEMYLNEAPYGGTAWGVGAAATYYFDKDISELSLSESVILAGLPQRPSAYSPFAGRTDTEGTPLWKVRSLGVLRRMQEDGFITPEEYNQVIDDFEALEFTQARTDIKAPHFVFYVRDQLEQLFGDELVERGGLKITTSLDMELQEEAQLIVSEEIEKVEELNITNGSAMVMDPETGEILAMVGSRDYFNSDIGGQFNVAVDGFRQPGSSLKPITYLTMLEKGYTPSTMIVDAPTQFAANDSEDPYEPKNYDGQFIGPVNLRNSLGSSLNIPAVKALAMVGVQTFLEQAYSMGLTSLEPTPENMRRFGLAVTLGGAEVTLQDSVVAFSSFANGGYRVEPISILKVEDLDGKVLFEHRPVQGSSVMSPESAFMINHMLSDNNARLMAFGANSLLNTGRPIAVKTGTTNDQRDNWTIGWSQEIMVGTWVGNNDNSPMTRVASGITGASPIWRRIMLSALEKGYGAPEWEVPAGVEQVELDAISGYPAHDEFPARTEYVARGTVPSLPDQIHSKVKLCRGEDKLANEARIAVGDYDEREFIILREDDPVSQDGRNRWQEGIDAWIQNQDDSRYNVPTEYCGEDSDVSVDLREPGDKKNFDDTEIEVEVMAGSGAGIEKIEVIARRSDGFEVKETVNSRQYKGELTLPAGKYEIYAIAFSRDDEKKESRKVRIGTGGVDWDQEDEEEEEEEEKPKPSPSPKVTPSPTPSPSPSGSPLLEIP